MSPTLLGYAFLGGLLPSLVWLYFVLKEDAAHPEPRVLVALAFIVGMTGVVFALPFEQHAKDALASQSSVIAAWALIEETIKYVLAAAFILWHKAVDEPTDYVIYLITVALGFAAAENFLFIVSPLLNGEIASSIYVGNLRFIGSTLLHVVASAAIGFALAFSDFSHPGVRVAAGAGGLILAIALHTAFNTLIMSEGTSITFSALFLVWMVAVVFLAMFEVLKYFQYRTSNS